MSSWHGTGPWDSLGEFQREVGRLLRTLEPLHALRAHRPFPAINLYDAGDRFIVLVELPGVTPEDFELTLTGETLTLRGDRKRPEGVGDESYRRQERCFGKWARGLTMPQAIDGSGVVADFAQGILTITLPKARELEPRQITVTTSSSH